MLTQQNLKTIEKIVREFFQKTTFEAEIEILPQENSTLFINLKAEEPQILIGDQGQTLAEVQHLLRIILRRAVWQEQDDKKTEEKPFFVDLDINDYKKKKTEYLEEMARSVADDVALMKKEKSLASMSAYERRIIHMALAGRSDVVTESVGQGPERKIIIKPRGN